PLPSPSALSTHSLHDALPILSTPVKAPAAGIVIASGPEKSLGNVIVVSHGYGFKTLYAHMSKLRVRTGQNVKRGDLIGEVGNTRSEEHTSELQSRFDLVCRLL